MEAFATVVDQGGFTDAAKKMGISKSAVSKHVSALEARLGARLLNRTTRRVSPDRDRPGLLRPRPPRAE
jgi:DNA-binding transcriptional LysR family regulator